MLQISECDASILCKRVDPDLGSENIKTGFMSFYTWCVCNIHPEAYISTNPMIIYQTQVGIFDMPGNDKLR